MTDPHTTCRCPAEYGVPATRWALYDARGVLAGTYATRALAEADAWGPRFRDGHTVVKCQGEAPSTARRLVGWRIAVLATGPHGGWQRVAAVTHVLRIAVTPTGKQRGCLFPMREDAVREARQWTDRQTRLIRVYRRRHAR